MEILYIILLSVSSAFVMFLLTKLMGNKQISQLTSFDYIIGITLGSIAAEMATSGSMKASPLLYSVPCPCLRCSLTGSIRTCSIQPVSTFWTAIAA